MDLEGHMIDQKWVKLYKKGQKVEILGLKFLLFSGIGVYPPPPLTENCVARNPLAEWGVPPPPLAEKIR